MRFRSARRSARILLGVSLLVALAPGCTSLKRRAYEGGSRDEWQQPDRVVRALGIEPGQRIADLGSGSGYFTFRLAAATGPRGRVYAVDVDESMNADLARRARKKGYENIQVVFAAEDDAQLPERVHWVFTSNTYHHLEGQVGYFARLRRHLLPGARVAVIEFSPRGWLHRLRGHWTSRDQILREMRGAGFELEAEHGFLERQSFLVFRERQAR